MVEGDHEAIADHHKEEGQSRIKADSMDRVKVHQKLEISIDPLDTDTKNGLVNIVTGHITDESVNVDDSVEIGTQMMEAYYEGWPNSFHLPLKKSVYAMNNSKKSNSSANGTIIDTSIIYSQILGLQSVRDIDLKKALSFELASIPPSMFDEKTQTMRLTASKSTLKSSLQVETNIQNDVTDARVIDGCAVLWIVTWPSHGTVEDYVRNFIGYLNRQLSIATTYIVFDRYRASSVKGVTRLQRAGQSVSRRHKLSLATPLPPQKICLTVAENKVQIISLIVSYIIDNKNLLVFNGKTLVITGNDPIPVELSEEYVKKRRDLETNQEEADTIIVQQSVYLAKSGLQNIHIVADDTDVFVLLIHFYIEQQLTSRILMIGSNISGKVVDIGETASKHSNIAKYLLAAHALSGCDTVSCLYGIGKTTVLKVLKSGVELERLGCLEESMTSIETECVKFMSACYGLKSEESMTSARYKVWSTKMANCKLNAAPELKVLPPTTETFSEHVKRAHLQAVTWKASLNVEEQ